MAEKVCLLSSEQAYQFETYAITPHCSHHKHLTKKQADTLERHKDIEHRTVRRCTNVNVSDGRRRLMLQEGRAWKKEVERERLTGYGQKLGIAGLQMVAKRASYIPLPHKVLGVTRAKHGETRAIVENGQSVDARKGQAVTEVAGGRLVPVLA